jgi:hypothetical protein
LLVEDRKGNEGRRKEQQRKDGRDVISAFTGG